MGRTIRRTGPLLLVVAALCVFVVADRRLKAEMLANARLERYLGGGFVVPSAAVVLRNGKHVVYVQSGPGVFEPREIGLSWQDSKQVVVARGLEVGDKVVVENTLLLARQYSLSQDAAEGADAPAAGGEAGKDAKASKASATSGSKTGEPAVNAPKQPQGAAQGSKP